MSIASFQKDPQAILDYAVDWSQWLESDTISSSSWTIPSGITNLADSHTSTQTLIRLSGGTDGVDYELINHVVLASSQEDERSILIQVRDNIAGADPILGSIYLEVPGFKDRAGMFGVGVALPSNDVLIASYLAAASRYVDARCNRKFDPDITYTEQHKWNPVTRRIYPYNAPVSSITSYKISVSAGTYATMPTNALYINNSERWVEVVSMTSATTLTPGLLVIGLNEAIVEISYKSTTDVEPHVALATGYIAASMMNQNYLSQSLPTGIKSIRIGSQAQLTLGDTSSASKDDATFKVPKIVDALLASESAIGVA